MQKAPKFLSRLRALRLVFARPAAAPQSAADPAFDQRLQKLGRVRPVSVSRAVLFRTRPEQREA